MTIPIYVTLEMPQGEQGEEPTKFAVDLQDRMEEVSARVRDDLKRSAEGQEWDYYGDADDN